MQFCNFVPLHCNPLNSKLATFFNINAFEFIKHLAYHRKYDKNLQFQIKGYFIFIDIADFDVVSITISKTDPIQSDIDIFIIYRGVLIYIVRKIDAIDNKDKKLNKVYYILDIIFCKY